MILTLMVAGVFFGTFEYQEVADDWDVPEIYDEYSEVREPELEVKNMSMLYTGSTSLGSPH